MARDEPQIDSSIDIVTPENIAFQYQLAGPFRRLPAYLIDIALRLAAWVLMTMLLGISGLMSFGGVTGMLLLFWFLLEWFYGGLFEAFWNGQTPGKRITGIRVLSRDGQPINALQAVLRNILRAADMMPVLPFSAFGAPPTMLGVPTYLVALSTQFLSRGFQRLGDIVCGTIVVVEDRSWLFGVSKLDDSRVVELAELIPANFQVKRRVSRALATYVERRKFFSRARRREIARHIAQPLIERFQLPKDTSYDLFVCALYHRTFIADQWTDQKESWGTQPSGLRGEADWHGSDTSHRRRAYRERPTMKVAEFLTQRRENWQELEQLCLQIESRRVRTLGPAAVDRFASLYRAACADLALADSYQLPPNAVQYLHRLVGCAHNQLYRSRSFDVASWGRSLLVEVPQRIFGDRCLHVAFCLFWGIFVMTTYLGWSNQWPRFAETMLSPEYVERLESDFSQPIAGRNASVNPDMASFYIQHNTGIGLQCFAGGLLLIPGLLVTVFNAAHLGAAFGYMARPDVAAGQNFFHFVTAHGPFELTAIVLSSAAGLRLGMSWICTNGLRRGDSLRKSAQEAMPLMGAAMIMFFLAALIEGFLSPSAAPYPFKATVAVLSSGVLMFYFVVLGYPRRTVSRQPPSWQNSAVEE